MNHWCARLKRAAWATIIVVAGWALALAGFLGYQTGTVQFALAQVMVFCGAWR